MAFPIKISMASDSHLPNYIMVYDILKKLNSIGRNTGRNSQTTKRKEQRIKEMINAPLDIEKMRPPQAYDNACRLIASWTINWLYDTGAARKEWNYYGNPSWSVGALRVRKESSSSHLCRRHHRYKSMSFKLRISHVCWCLKWLRGERGKELEMDSVVT